jgi:hypothetical protein
MGSSISSAQKVMRKIMPSIGCGDASFQMTKGFRELLPPGKDYVLILNAALRLLYERPIRDRWAAVKG